MLTRMFRPSANIGLSRFVRSYVQWIPLERESIGLTKGPPNCWRERRETNGKRDVILVKGREGGLVGRAFNVLAALQRVSPALRKYRIKIVMPTESMRGAVQFVARFSGLDIEVMERLPYRDLMKLFATSRMAIAASDVDGTPSFLVEAMAMGALPIHSDMESVREWITDGVNGLLFPVEDVDALASHIERAIQDDALVEQARARNAEIVRARMDRGVIRERIGALMRQVVLPGRTVP